MKRISFLGVILLTLVSVVNAQTDSRSFSVNGFDKLSLGSAFKINVTQGSSFKLEASGEKVDLDDLEAKVTAGTLFVKFKENRNKRKGVSLEIRMPSLSGISLSGAANMKATGFKEKNELKLDVSGAAKLVLDVTTDVVDFDFSGASSITLTGRANVLKGDISGASSFKGMDFPVKEAQIDASGASSASVKTSSKLTADASGASSIRYSGGAQDIRMNTSGGSSVKKSD